MTPPSRILTGNKSSSLDFQKNKIKRKQKLPKKLPNLPQPHRPFQMASLATKSELFLLTSLIQLVVKNIHLCKMHIIEQVVVLLSLILLQTKLLSKKLELLLIKSVG
eukprot:Lithocolla_globosa_v1_NODE_873_length_3154_cov_4.260084.p2 type:complete len:107 gc:universal NODE_873_length_3154_cov_4.260084:2643-2323(-)